MPLFLLVVLLVPALLLYEFCSRTIDKTIMPSRGAILLLLLGAIALPAILAIRSALRGGDEDGKENGDSDRARPAPVLPGVAEQPASWRARLLAVHPIWWCVAALIWQSVVLALRAPVIDPGALAESTSAGKRVIQPGLLWISERAGALAVAWSIAVLWLGKVSNLTIAGLGLTGVGILVFASLAQVVIMPLLPPESAILFGGASAAAVCAGFIVVLRRERILPLGQEIALWSAVCALAALVVAGAFWLGLHTYTVETQAYKNAQGALIPATSTTHHISPRGLWYVTVLSLLGAAAVFALAWRKETAATQEESFLRTWVGPLCLLGLVFVGSYLAIAATNDVVRQRFSIQLGLGTNAPFGLGNFNLDQSWGMAAVIFGITIAWLCASRTAAASGSAANAADTPTSSAPAQPTALTLADTATAAMSGRNLFAVLAALSAALFWVCSAGSAPSASASSVVPIIRWCCGGMVALVALLWLETVRPGPARIVAVPALALLTPLAGWSLAGTTFTAAPWWCLVLFGLAPVLALGAWLTWRRWTLASMVNVALGGFIVGLAVLISYGKAFPTVAPTVLDATSAPVSLTKPILLVLGAGLGGLAVAALLWFVQRRMRPEPVLREGSLGLVLIASWLLGLLALLWLGMDLMDVGDKVRSAWIGLGATVFMLVLFRLPWRAQLPLLLGVATVTLVGQLLWYCLAAESMFAFGGQSFMQRGYFMQAALQSLQSPIALLCGHGPGTELYVMHDEPAAGLFWMAVPSFAEHVHQEFVNVVVDGGLVLVFLLGFASFSTLAPLWRRRDEPAAQGLLTAWVASFSFCLSDPHLSQTGPLVCLGVLAGVTWAWSASPLSAAKRLAVQHPEALPASPVAPPPMPAHKPGAIATGMALGCIAAIALAVSFVLDKTVNGPPPITWGRAMDTFNQHYETAVFYDAHAAKQQPAARAPFYAEADTHWGEALKTIRELRDLLGPLHNLNALLARCERRLGNESEAERLIVRQLEWLPPDGESLQEALIQYERSLLRNPERAQRLLVAMERAAQRARAIHAQVPHNKTNNHFRAHSAQMLDLIDLQLLAQGRKPSSASAAAVK